MQQLAESPENHAEWKKPVPTGDMLYGSINGTSFTQQTYREHVTI